MDDADHSPRPAKRPRLDTAAQHQRPQQLSLATLLLSLPSLLLHPPTHTNHERSLALSYHALKKCSALTSLDRVVDCRASTALVELGLQTGLASPGIQDEIQKAITKASLIAQNLPSLHFYRCRLTHLSSQLSLASGNAKAAQNNLKRSLTASGPNELPHILYTTHLALIASISSQSSDETSSTMKSLGVISDLHELALKQGHQPIVQLASVLRLRALMRSGLWNEVGESLDSAESILSMEEALKTPTDDKGKVPEAKPPSREAYLPSPPPSSTAKAPTRSSFEYALIVHTLILGIIFHTYTGDSNSASIRLKWLHELLDLQLPHFPRTGIFEIPFENSPPLYFQLTHPRIVYVLGFLVSSLAKRDLIGKKPKKKVFAAEGINAVDRELKKELAFPTWASISDVEETDCRLKRIRADLTCELIGACIIRSEFDNAEHSIDELISYTRTHGIFSSYVARITLHEAHLAHALSKPKRALQCYQVAAWLSRKRSSTPHSTNNNAPPSDSIDGEEDPWVNAAARASELWLRIGLLRQNPNSERSEEEVERQMEELRKTGIGVIKDCRGLGGTLEAIAEVLEGCLTKEFVKAKTHLRRALNLSTASQDNHLRALVLSLIASHYLHTSNQHAEKMLETAENLAAGLAAQPKNPKNNNNNNNNNNITNNIISNNNNNVRAGQQNLGTPAINSNGNNGNNSNSDDKTPPGYHPPPGFDGGAGNTHLRLWIGERFLELYNRAGNKAKAKMQTVKNKRLSEVAAGRITERG